MMSSKHSAFALVFVVACGALGWSVVAGGCATSKPQEEPAEQPATALNVRTPLSDATLVAKSARGLPPIEGESLRAFLARTEAALLAAEHPALAAQVRSLPRSSTLWTTPAIRAFAPVLIAAHARSSTQAKTLKTLQDLVRHQTVNPSESKAPGEGPAFVAFGKDLAAFATAHQLSFDASTRGIWLVGMKASREGIVPNFAASVGVLTHADVVPATEANWVHDPFAGKMVGDRLIARGALDDKGAIAALMSALATLGASDVPLLRLPLLIIGTSEETHWAGIERLKAERTLPRTMIVADGSFPLGIGEKGITTVTLTATHSPPGPPIGDTHHPFHVVEFNAGEVANQVPPSATAVLEPVNGEDALAALLDTTKHETKDIDVAWVKREASTPTAFEVTVVGKAAHSAKPELGKNAALDLLAFLDTARRLAIPPTSSPPPALAPCGQLFAELHQKLGRGFDPTALDVTTTHPQFGPPTANLGVIRFDAKDSRCEAKINLRWPPPTPAADVVKQVCGAFDTTLLSCGGGGLDPFLISPKSDIVATLGDSYQVVFDAPPTPVTIAGTTYAKAVDGAVTFGPGPARPPSGHARIHAANEFITTGELADLVEVYTLALTKLALTPGTPSDANGEPAPATGRNTIR